MVLTIWYFHGKHWLNGVAQSARWTAYYLEAEHREHSVSCLQRCCISLPGQITHCQDMKSETAQRQLVTFLYSLWGSFYCSDQTFVQLFVTEESRHESTQSYSVPNTLAVCSPFPSFGFFIPHFQENFRKDGHIVRNISNWCWRTSVLSFGETEQYLYLISTGWERISVGLKLG